ncbi:hypothetical protein BV509_08225 [Rhodovulum sulfidophilum]|uniref:Uncharacterized protein n=1 Tax=Rhodovulum visakhapatnamense TaxID=364297 RepID=A0ABS1REL1_9RHOB|nr:hypothetical protein [Rhodovulum visakhapatnamense]MBL3571728.1 hypothetical protein [Rhodovulum visakhapatnamense]MBL3578080.1 hypothetical protein [Rhodovulum visakhapatnamense]OLS44328.1 hypothetical protein BV509_08225 [Rhodovulum sulfidophilum]
MLAALVASISMAMPAAAMDFILGGTDHRSNDATWIQADGQIDETTLEDFVTFLDEGPDGLPKRIRLNSPGGNLLEGIQLGEELRRRGFTTEVGDHEPHPDWPNMPYWDFTRRTPGVCASACAYAFMGGIERRIDPGSRIGVHQFYRAGRAEGFADGAPVLVQEGVEQTLVSLLLDYILRMGVDGRILVNAGLSGPDEMYWIEEGAEARETGLIYASAAWSEWDIELLGEGVIAVSERADRKYKMAALCTESGGAYFDIFAAEEPAEESAWSLRSWLVDQCLPAGSYSQGQGAHRILGNRVEASSIRIVDRPGGFGVRFPLGRSPVVQGTPSFLYDDAAYGACITEKFLGNEKNMEPAIRIAFRNCIQ